MEFEIIEDLSALDAEALDAYIAAAEAAARELTEDDSATIDLIERALAILDSRDAAKAALESLSTAESERTQRLADVRARATAEPEADPEAEADPEVEVEVEVEAEAVAASAARRPSALARAAARAPKPKAPVAKPQVTITAAADVPMLSTGQHISFKDLTGPATDVINSLSRTLGNTRVSKGLATIGLPRTDGLVATAGMTDISDLVDRAGDESRLPGGSLIAAGGWCAPSETDYTLYDYGESTDGLWNIPSVNVPRGGLSFFRGPQFSDFYAGTFIHQTEAQAEAGTTKSCTTITCPDPVEVRLDVDGVCISVPILTNAAFPELVQRWMTGTMIAHQHKMSAWLLTAALTVAGTAQTIANPWPTASGSILAALELVVLGERQRYRLSENATLEAVFPMWVKGLIRADLAMRTGVDLLQVTDQQIVAYFALRGVRAQFVYNWQDLTITSGTAQLAAADYPANLEVLLYPAGTFVQGTKDVITLNALYDSTKLATNDYTALFTEEGISLMWRRFAPRRIKLAVQVTGLTGAAIVDQDWGTSASTAAAPYPVLAPASA